MEWNGEFLADSPAILKKIDEEVGPSEIHPFAACPF